LPRSSAASNSRERGAIWDRVSKAFDPFHHGIHTSARRRLGWLACQHVGDQDAGKASARELAAGGLNLDVLAEEDADAAHNTPNGAARHRSMDADVYLLFLRACDAWPAGDLAVQEAASGRPKARPTVRWRRWPSHGAPCAAPPRTVVGHYRVLKKREGVIK
jgi:DNA-3-methyladenine glycosylase II